MLTRRLVAWPCLTERDLRLWRELLQRTAGAPDLSVDWGDALISAHQIPPNDAAALFIENGTTAHAIIPLHFWVERKFGLPVRRVQPLNSVFCLHLELLTDLDSTQILAQLLTFLEGRDYGWSALHLNSLIDGGATARAAVEQARLRRLSVEQEGGNNSPFLEINSDWETFLRSKSANFRSNLKRKTRKIREAASVGIRFIADPEEVAVALRDIEIVERGSWKASAGTAITSRKWEERFYSVLADRFSHAGQLLVTLLTLDGKPVAHDLTIMGGGRAYCLKTSFDGAYAELSPGMVLRAELMHRLFESGIREYDFLGNNERYKLEWTDTVRRSISIRVFNTRTAAGLVLALRSRMRSARGGTLETADRAAQR
jgi:CelD/BcsL family acetyltransferase involved in cellulose biosynthesis